MRWYDKEKGRFLLEVRLLRRHYPEARIIVNDGILVIFKKVMGKRRNYLLKIVYPNNFPQEVPSAYVVKPEIGRTPHSFSSGRLCLHSAREAGPQLSGKVIMDWSTEWVAAYERWLKSGKSYWPAMRRR